MPCVRGRQRAAEGGKRAGLCLFTPGSYITKVTVPVVPSKETR